MIYFAYGSNMSHQQMKERCPSGRFIGRARLENYKFVYDGYSQKRKGAVANIIKAPDSVVWGGLFEINADNLARLDRYEGYSLKAYDRADDFTVVNDSNEKLRATSYFRTGLEVGEPHEEYRSAVKCGALDCALPAEYIDQYL